MVFSQRQRDPLLPGLSSGDIGCVLDAAFRVVAEVCEAFYDTLTLPKKEPETMVLPGELAALTALATGSIAEYEPTIDPETGEVRYPKAAQYLNSDDASSSAVLDAFAERNIGTSQLISDITCRTRISSTEP